MTAINLQPPASLLKPALVLNRNWQPINVATVARALIMLWNDSAKIVDPIDYQLYDWSDWSRMVPDRDEPFIQSVRQPCQSKHRFSIDKPSHFVQLNQGGERIIEFRRRQAGPSVIGPSTTLSAKLLYKLPICLAIESGKA